MVGSGLSRTMDGDDDIDANEVHEHLLLLLKSITCLSAVFLELRLAMLMLPAMHRPHWKHILRPAYAGLDLAMCNMADVDTIW